MSTEPNALVALFGQLAQAEAALHALQGAGVPYPAIRLLPQRAGALADTAAANLLPGEGWALAVVPEGDLWARAEELLRGNGALVVGRGPAPRDEVEDGAVAWRHYVFDPAAPTAQVTDAAGQSGTTGINRSGVFGERGHS
ncbi:MAG TPA: hypothetical protein VFS21_19415 [Roseiflexaceae bacterium]|nr:hypothetical protein [Roseiflexaceae bacterium]